MQFARVAHATDFLYCYSIIEANRRSEYASPSTQVARRFVNPVVLGESVQTDLNTFFPFDPYKLPRSGTYIESVYREWSSVAIGDDEDEDDEEEEDGNGGEPPLSPSYSYDGLSSPVAFRPRKDSEADQLGASFGGMSISPAHPPVSMSLSSAMSVS